VLNMNILTLNSQRRKLKDWCFKMPNLSYCHPLNENKTNEKWQNLNFFTQRSGVKVFKCGLDFLKLHGSAKVRRQKNVFTIMLTEPISINIPSNR